MAVVFELTMPGKGSWNGKWTGEEVGRGRRMNNTLKPCPFCGGDAIEYFHNGKDYCTAHIICKVCGASTKPYVGTERYVVQATRFEWNRRVKDEREE